MSAEIQDIMQTAENEQLARCSSGWNAFVKYMSNENDQIRFCAVLYVNRKWLMEQELFQWLCNSYYT